MTSAEWEVGQRRSYTDTHGGPPDPDAVYVIQEWDGEDWQTVAVVNGKEARDQAVRAKPEGPRS